MPPLVAPDPPLEFGRGRLRVWEPADAVVLLQAWTDPEIVRWNPVPKDRTLAETEEWIIGSDARLRAGLALDLCIVDDRGEVVGEVGLAGFDHDRAAAMVGWWLLPGGRGRGLATGAVRAVTTWAADSLGLQLIVARCATDNHASQRVADRAGYTHARSDADGFELWAFRGDEADARNPQE